MTISRTKNHSIGRERLLKPLDVAEWFGVSRQTLYRMIEKREIPFYKIGGQIRFQEADLEKYLQDMRVVTSKNYEV